MPTLRQQLDDLIDKLTPEMEKAFDAAVDDIKPEIVLPEIIESLGGHDVQGAPDALQAILMRSTRSARHLRSKKGDSENANLAAVVRLSFHIGHYGRSGSGSLRYPKAAGRRSFGGSRSMGGLEKQHAVSALNAATGFTLKLDFCVAGSTPFKRTYQRNLPF